VNTEEVEKNMQTARQPFRLAVMIPVIDEQKEIRSKGAALENATNMEKKPQQR
jgi:hypothetical protein